MNTHSYRRTDGKFGVESGEVSNEVSRQGFTKKGEKRPPGAGRRAGTPNKLKAEITELRSEFSGGAEPNTGAGIQDELEFLRWIWQNPEHRLDLRMKAASEAAQYKYAKKRDFTHHNEGLAQTLEERFKAGQQRVDADRTQQAGGVPTETPRAHDERAREEHERATGETPEAETLAKAEELRKKLESPEAVLERMRRDPGNWGRVERAQDGEPAPPLTETEITARQQKADSTLARLRNGEPAPTRGNYDVPSRLKRDSVDEWSRKQ